MTANMRIRTEPLRDFTIGRFIQMRPVIDLNPPYQREGDVWKQSTREVLIDSIINRLDVPKLYFEESLERRQAPNGLSYEYAVIDGRQRLESIIAFAEGRLQLADDFYYFEDETVDAKGMNLGQLAQSYPELEERFWSFVLPIVVVHANSGDLVEEMFQRLNASTALNAAEKRNAILSKTRDIANELAEHRLLVNCSPIRSARYKYRELAAKFLAIEHQIFTRDKIVDTKAATLLQIFRATTEQYRSITDAQMELYGRATNATLDRMTAFFVEADPLLRSIGTVVVYYIAFRDEGFSDRVNREMLNQFEELRRSAARMTDSDPAYGERSNTRLREYNVLVQSTNDGSALSRRAEILTAFVDGWSETDPAGGLRNLAEVSLDVADNAD